MSERLQDKKEGSVALQKVYVLSGSRLMSLSNERLTLLPLNCFADDLKSLLIYSFLSKSLKNFTLILFDLRLKPVLSVKKSGKSSQISFSHSFSAF